MIQLKRKVFDLNNDYSNVKSISLYINQLRDFIPIIQQNPNITSINLSGNSILGYEHDIINLLQTTNIIALDLSNLIKDNLIPILYIIGVGLKNNKTLKHLYISNVDNLYFEKIETDIKEDETKKYNKVIEMNKMNIMDCNILYKEFFIGLNTSNIKYINLSNNRINDLFLEIFFKNIKPDNIIETLILNNNEISNLIYIEDFLKESKNIKCLSLMNNNISELYFIGRGLIYNKSLINLYLTNNPIKNIIDLCDGIINNRTLSQLHLEECEIINIDRFETVLKNNNTLLYLNLKNNKIKNITNFCAGLTSNKSLKYLNLGFNQIENIDELGKSLNKNNHLHYLILENNKIKDINLLSYYLNSSSLTYLDLGYNYINNIFYLGEALKKNVTLNELCINNNLFDCLEPITNALYCNSSLSTLHLGFKISHLNYYNKIHCNYDEEHYKHLDFKDFSNFIDVLKVNSSLTSLNLNGDNSPDLKYLYKMLEFNTSLYELQLLNYKSGFNHNSSIKELQSLNDPKGIDCNVLNPNSAINSQFLNELEKNYTLTSIYF